MSNIKISQLPVKGANLAAADLLEVSEFTGTGYVSKSITGQEIIDAASGGGVDWGDITGTLSSQTDLQTALDAKQDDLVSGTNIKTINGSSVLGSGDLTIGGGGGNLLATHILSKPRSLFYYSLALTAGNLNAAAISPNVLFPTNFTPAYDLTINTLIIQITTAFVGGLAKVAIYSDLDGVPHTKLFESVDVSTDTTGSKTITGFSFTFTGGTTYWIATLSNNGSIGFRVMNVFALMTAPVIASSPTTQVYTSWYIPVTYASLPTTLTTPTTGNLNHWSIPHLVFRAV